MRILLDECVNPRLRAAFPGHELLVTAEAFDVFVTIDRGFEHQHNRSRLGIGIVIIRARRNRLSLLQPLFAEILRAAEEVKAGEIRMAGEEPK